MTQDEYEKIRAQVKEIYLHPSKRKKPIIWKNEYEREEILDACFDTAWPLIAHGAGPEQLREEVEKTSEAAYKLLRRQNPKTTGFFVTQRARKKGK